MILRWFFCSLLLLTEKQAFSFEMSEFSQRATKDGSEVDSQCAQDLQVWKLNDGIKLLNKSHRNQY